LEAELHVRVMVEEGDVVLVGDAWLVVAVLVGTEVEPVDVRVLRFVGESVALGSADERVERLVGDDSVGGEGKSLGWLRVATILAAVAVL
jgi:hypothetical protein